MFCQKCGNKHEVEAKFCPACGNALNGNAAGRAPSSEQVLEEKVFLSENGILVSDAVFKTSSGQSYPVRNISSVAVAQKNASVIAVVLAIFLTLLGILMFISGKSDVVGIGAVFLVLSAPFWYVVANRPHQLKIGAGGVLQIAIEATDEPMLERVAKSINDAIIYIQRGGQPG